MAPLLMFLLIASWSRSIFVHGLDPSPCHPAIFVFGDSLSDTGNGVLTGNVFFQRTTQYPYGETYPGQPFNRFSDGRLIVDFLAQSVGLPLVNPSLNSSKDFSRGVNYAVAGATALNSTFLATKLVFPLTNRSLEVQLDWHLAFKASIASSGAGPGQPDLPSFQNGLYVIEIGGNDYSSAFNTLYTPAYVNTTFVPLVIQKIRQVTEALYNSGARKFLYISITPLGCGSSYLATYPLAAKDSDGCLKDYNSVANNHGFALLREVQNLRTAHTDASFLFADYYAAYTNVLRNKATYGFNDAFDACCGAGPLFPYNYNILLFCNSLSNVCDNPHSYLNWDGIHLTDKFNRIVTNKFIDGSYLNPPNGLNFCASVVSI